MLNILGHKCTVNLGKTIAVNIIVSFEDKDRYKVSPIGSVSVEAKYDSVTRKPVYLHLWYFEKCVNDFKFSLEEEDKILDYIAGNNLLGKVTF